MTSVVEQFVNLDGSRSKPRIAVLIPCLNEEASIARVVQEFRDALPGSTIFVYDNNSTDRTREIARAEGAVVRREARQGKGNVVRRMFADIEADIYVLVDGDATYDAASASRMADLLQKERLDMVVGVRVQSEEAAYRRGHVTGNRLLTRFVGGVFGTALSDLLSGYRVFSRRFVKSFPGVASGFEIETELTVHALQLSLPTAEMATPYFARAENSSSKLSTWRDGLRILSMIIRLCRFERPFAFFGSIGVALAATSILLFVPVALHFLAEGNVPRFPTLILSTALMLAAVVCFASALILDTVTRGRREMKLLAYLACKGAAEEDAH